MARLAGKVAFVTGGASGIGRATAKLFASEGARIVVVDINRKDGESCVREITEAGGEALFVPTDISSETEVAGAFRSGTERFGRIDILHNSAGGSSGRDGSIVDRPVEELWRVMQLDLLGTVLACRNALPLMRQQRSGSIINMSSVVSLIGVPDLDFYTAAKGAVSALTRTLALQHGSANIRINAIAPGVTMTERVRQLSGGDVSKFPLARKQVLGPAEPIDIAGAALFLASDESVKVTGVVLPVDGGASAW